MRSDFELGIWSESTLDELPVAFYCASLAATVFDTRWLELRNYDNHATVCRKMFVINYFRKFREWSTYANIIVANVYVCT